MTDYIKREDAIKAFENICIPRKATNGIVVLDIDEALSEIELVPSADVVEVVRCKDCKYHAEFSSKCNKLHLTPMRPNDYCSFGERAET